MFAHASSFAALAALICYVSAQSYYGGSSGSGTTSSSGTGTTQGSGTGTTQGSGTGTTQGTGGATTTPPGGTTNAKQLVINVINAIKNNDANDPSLAFIDGTNFVQHNLGDPNGKNGVIAFIKLLAGNAQTNIVRVAQDGDTVWAHSVYDVFGPKMGVDVFRFKNGLMVEHWDSLETTIGPNSQGRNMSDGAVPTSPVTDLDKTAANKQLITDFITKVWIGGDSSQIQNYFDGNNLIQHDPVFTDGITGANAAWASGAQTQGLPVTWTYLYKVLGEGNFVLSMAQGQQGSNGYSMYDIWRVANGKIAEHWNVNQVIPPIANWTNQNGKYVCPVTCTLV